MTQPGAMAQKVAQSVEAAKLADSDAAAAHLATVYAFMMDTAFISNDVSVIEKLGPKLLATLKELGLTPAGRTSNNSKPKGGESNERTAPGSALDSLRNAAWSGAFGSPRRDGQGRSDTESS